MLSASSYLLLITTYATPRLRCRCGAESKIPPWLLASFDILTRIISSTSHTVRQRISYPVSRVIYSQRERYCWQEYNTPDMSGDQTVRRHIAQVLHYLRVKIMSQVRYYTRTLRASSLARSSLLFRANSLSLFSAMRGDSARSLAQRSCASGESSPSPSMRASCRPFAIPSTSSSSIALGTLSTKRLNATGNGKASDVSVDNLERGRKRITNLENRRARQP